MSTSQGRVRLVFRNFPLFEVHPHALTAALAAESTAASGGESAFWAMHAKLFAHQARLSGPDLRLYAEAVGADPDLAVGDAAQQFAPIVQADYASGIEAGVSAHPDPVRRRRRLRRACWTWEPCSVRPACPGVLPRRSGADHGSGGRDDGAASPAGEQREVRSPITRRIQAPSRAATSEPLRMPILASSRSAASEKARSVMNREIVKPTPARTAPPNRWL